MSSLEFRPEREPETGRVLVRLDAPLDLALVQGAGVRAFTFYDGDGAWLSSQRPGVLRPAPRGVRVIEVVEFTPHSSGVVRAVPAKVAETRESPDLRVRLFDAPWAGEE